jgi:hypothetical protein
MCTQDLYPTASYAPGYQVFIAAVYLVAGRSLNALMVLQALLLLLMVLMLDDVARRLLPKEGHVFVLLAALTYPFLARQAGRVMSDHLHAVLFLGVVWGLVSLKPGARRGAVVGLLLSAATLTRPYSLVCFPVFLLPVVRRRLQMSPSELMAFAMGAAAPFAVWIVRNAIVFGKFIPFTASGLGAALYLNKLEWTVGSAIDGDNARAIYAELREVAQGDFNTWAGNKTLQREALTWMASNPGLVLLALVKRVPRVWVSMGTQGAGLHPAALVLALHLGGLLALGVAGLWVRRKESGPWLAMGLMVVAYWAFLMHTPAEARRTLPLRWPMLVFAGAAVAELLSWWRGRQRLSVSVESVASTESTGR